MPEGASGWIQGEPAARRHSQVVALRGMLLSTDRQLALRRPTSPPTNAAGRDEVKKKKKKRTGRCDNCARGGAKLSSHVRWRRVASTGTYAHIHPHTSVKATLNVCQRGSDCRCWICPPLKSKTILAALFSPLFIRENKI